MAASRLSAWKANSSRFQHTATRRWLPECKCYFCIFEIVSTHSHPKVAASCKSQGIHNRPSFNTQPPEGGCLGIYTTSSNSQLFQHTATRRWLRSMVVIRAFLIKFQHTATRRWLPSRKEELIPIMKFQHTATRRWLRFLYSSTTPCYFVSTHSHPKVAACV